MPDITKLSDAELRAQYLKSLPDDQLRSMAAQAQPSRLSEAASMITDIPGEIGREYSGAVQNIKQFGKYARSPEMQKPLDVTSAEGLGTLGRGTLGGLSALGSAAYLGTGIGPAIVGTAKSLWGHGMQAITPDRQPGGYEQYKGDIDRAMLALKPGAGTRVPIPQAPKPGPFGVTLQEGAIPKKVTAAGEARVGEFKEQQASQLASAKERVSKAFDIIGQQRLAETPGHAGEIVGEGIQKAEQRAKATYEAGYEKAKSLPGEIAAPAFDNIGTAIKTGLSTRRDPVIVDDILTPHASRMILNIDNDIEQLRRAPQNRADPMGHPARGSIAGINLAGVDQIRKRLGAFRSAAYASGNKTDGRAAQAVMDAFDDHIDQAIKGGMFQGDPRAIKAWTQARADYADYRKTFSSSGRGTVSDVVQKIIGGRERDPATGNDIADFAYGSTGVAPKALNVGVMREIKRILGADSPEWSAARQGLFERIVTPAQGEYKPMKIKDRLNRFLTGEGREMANEVFSPAERQMLQRFADLHGQMEIMKEPLQPGMLKAFAERIGHRLNLLIAGIIGHAGVHGILSAGPLVAAQKVTGAAMEMREARTLAEKLPLVTEQMAKWRQAVVRSQQANNAQNRRLAMNAMIELVHRLNTIGVYEQGPQSSQDANENVAYGGPQQ